MTERLAFHVVVLIVIVLLRSTAKGSSTTHELTTSLRVARVIYTDEIGLPHPSGLAFSPDTQTFLALPIEQTGRTGSVNTEIVRFTFFGDPAGSARIQVTPENSINVAFDEGTNSLFLFSWIQDELIAVKMAENGLPDQVIRVDAPQFGVRDPQGMTFDSANGRLFILDSAKRRIVRVEPDSQQPGASAIALVDSRITEIELSDESLADLRGIAFNPGNGRLYLIDPERQLLYELTEMGEITAAFDLSGFGLRDPQGMLFAASGDLTDDPHRMSLYVADSGITGRGKVVELALAELAPSLPTVETSELHLVQIIDTSQFSPPSPDPSGLAYLSDENRLLVGDSEVNETPLYEGANAFESTLLGELTGTFNTTAFSDEPSGVAYKPDGRHLFFADDNDDEVYELRPGLDGHYGTADDILSSFDTRAFNSYDPEGITYEGVEDRLFIVDGINAEVYEVSAGPNGIFDGVDDEVAHFDTEGIGILDPEGIAFNPDTGNLYVVGKPDELVAEVTTTGELVQLIDISEADARKPSGLAYAHRSNDETLMSLYVAERGVDNDTDPSENDGKVYELALDIAASAPTPTPEPAQRYIIYIILITTNGSNNSQ